MESLAFRTWEDIRESSAKREAKEESRRSSMSLIIITKRMGPRTVPLGHRGEDRGGWGYGAVSCHLLCPVIEEALDPGKIYGSRHRLCYLYAFFLVLR